MRSAMVRWRTAKGLLNPSFSTFVRPVEIPDAPHLLCRVQLGDGYQPIGDARSWQRRFKSAALHQMFGSAKLMWALRFTPQRMTMRS